MNIINDITGKIIKHMAYLADKPLSGQAALAGAVEDTLGLMMEIGADIIRDYIEMLEEGLITSEDRKAEWNVHIKNREKTIATKLGDITYKRTYYRNRETGAFRHLVDDLLEVEPHERIDLGLKEDMLKKAKEMSYQQVIDSYDNISITSRTTVKNVVHKAPMETAGLGSIEKPKEKKRKEYLSSISKPMKIMCTNKKEKEC